MKKESKTACFEGAEFTARLINGELDEITVTSKKKSFVLSAEEAGELYDWIGSTLGKVAGSPSVGTLLGSYPALGSPAVSGQTTASDRTNPVPPAPLAPGYVPLEERGKQIVIVAAGDDKAVRDAARDYLSKPHPNDAQTVAHLLPIEAVLKREDMKLETKDVPAQVVKFSGGSVEVV